jgi:hypothetical protein
MSPPNGSPASSCRKDVVGRSFSSDDNGMVSLSGISGVVGEKMRECDEGNTLTMSTNCLLVICRLSGFANREGADRDGQGATPHSRVNFGKAAEAKQWVRAKGTSVNRTTSSLYDEVPLYGIQGVYVTVI